MQLILRRQNLYYGQNTGKSITQFIIHYVLNTSVTLRGWKCVALLMALLLSILN